MQRTHDDLHDIICQVVGYPLSSLAGITTSDVVDMRARRALVSELYMLSSLSLAEIEALIPGRLSEIRANIYLSEIRANINKSFA